MATATSSNLDFAAPVNGGTARALDGNVAPNRGTVTGNVNFDGAGWAPGTFLVIRFDASKTASGSSNGLAIDDFNLTGSAATQPTKPVLTNPTANPSTVPQGGQTLLSVQVTPGTNPTSTDLKVIGNLSILGGSATQTFFDDGTNGDESAGDGKYSYLATVSPTATTGTPSISVTVSDAQNRVDGASIPLTVTAKTSPSTTLVISEFRVAGPGNGTVSAANDEFVEILNLSTAPIDIAGYQLLYGPSSGSTPSPRTVTYGPNTVIPAGGRFLFSAVGGSVEAASNATFNAGLATTGGIAIADASGTILDAAGLSTGTALKEGNPITGSPAPATQSFERLELGVNTRDTQNNASDFTIGTANPQGLPPAGNLPPTFGSATFSTTVDQPFSRQLQAQDPEGATLTYTLLSGTLPTGAPDVTLSPTGLLSGTPNAAGNFNFRVSVSDGANVVTGRFLIIVSAASDGSAPVFEPLNLPSSGVTRDQLAAMSVSGNVRDVAPAGVVPVGVSRVRFQLRRDRDGFAYNGNAFTSNNSLYYPATLSASSDGTTAGTRSFSRSFDFLPPTLELGSYSLIVFSADNNNNYRVEIKPITIIAPPPAMAPAPDVPPAQAPPSRKSAKIS